VARLQSRLVRAAGLGALTAGLAALAVATLVGVACAGSPAHGLAVGLAMCVVITIIGVRRARRVWTPLTTAGLIEARVPALDNLIVTFVELAHAPDHASDRMRAEVARQAAERATRVQATVVAPMGPAVAALALVAVGTGAVVWSALTSREVGTFRTVSPAAPVGIASVRARVTPPAYLGGAPRESENPERLEVPEGGRLRLEVLTSERLAWSEDADAGPRPLGPDSEGRFTLEWTPTRTGTLAIAAGSTTGVADETRLLGVAVVPDESPRVRVVMPGRDLAFTTPAQVVNLAIEATDTEGLRALEVRFVRMSGSGEAFDFTEGRVPLQVERASEVEWRAHARWSLAALGLEDGDSLVYRAVVRDSNPDAEWVSSDPFTIDIGARLEMAGAGFAVTDEDRRYAISQQMVILKTERLEAERGKHAAGPWAEQSRLLAIEQRMVRAEVVFLSGGEIQDEEVEAEHSHELQEGRLENAGRVEMLRAINEMSRAEARLNAGDTRGALVFEQSALASLQRAFDRRRYFLRTLPERSRIDTTRRLTGDRRDARSSTRLPPPEPVDRLGIERALMSELAAIAGDGRMATSSVVARLASVEASGAWRALAQALASAASAGARQEAARAAMNAVASHARTKLAPAADRGTERAGALTGWWAEELRAGRPR
jgi:hypothetical protein